MLRGVGKGGMRAAVKISVRSKFHPFYKYFGLKIGLRVIIESDEIGEFLSFRGILFRDRSLGSCGEFPLTLLLLGCPR